MEESRNPFKILLGKPKRKIPFGRPKRRWEDNTRKDLKEIREIWFIRFRIWNNGEPL